MIDGIIALIIGFITELLLQPWFDKYTEYQLERGIPIESFNTQLNLINLVFQITAFLIIYGLIKLIKFILKKFSWNSAFIDSTYLISLFN